jgi:hypothetical protein
MALCHLIEPSSSHSGSALPTVTLSVPTPVENSDKVECGMALSTVALRKRPFSGVTTMYVNDLRIRHSGMVSSTVKARITVVGFDLLHCETQWWEPNHCGTTTCGKPGASQCDRENHCSTALYKERIYIRGRARTREGDKGEGCSTTVPQCDRLWHCGPSGAHTNQRRHNVMTKDQFAEFLLEVQAQESQVRQAGQKEYAHDDNNAFSNFERLALDLGISREMVLWVYLKKHLDGILAYINGHRSQRESIDQRIKDARMYLALLWGMTRERDDCPISKTRKCVRCLCFRPVFEFKSRGRICFQCRELGED